MNNGSNLQKETTNENLLFPDSNYKFQIKSTNNTSQTNFITTSKYNCYNFLPKLLFTQFSQLINLFFLMISICELIPQISDTDGLPLQLISLICIIFINGSKDYIEDYNRRKFDNTENNREVLIFNRQTKKFCIKASKEIKLGDIIKVLEHEQFPVDLLLIGSKNLENDNLNDCSEEELGMSYIESKNLDGETNLKFKQAPFIIADKFRKEESYYMLDGLLECSAPNEKLNEFAGRYFENFEDKLNFLIIDKKSLLLRGCSLKQTYCCYGIALYIGHNTKMLKNYPAIKIKKAKIVSKINKQIIILIIIQFSVSILSEILNEAFNYKFENILYSQEDLPDNNRFIRNFFRFILFFKNIIPISLFLSIEIKGLFVSWDCKLISKENFKYPIVNTSELNEDLGQVSFIFSDKTGTLTKNIMTFKEMSIGKYKYGQENFQKTRLKLSDKYGKIKNFNFYDFDFLQHQKDDDHENYYNIKYFLLCICLCNTIFVETDSKNCITFEGTSPDEISLINAARYFNYIFLKRLNGNIILLEIFGVVKEYTIIHYLDYSSERKCMSVIVLSPEGRIFVFTKGADSILLNKVTVNPNLIKFTDECLVSYAKKGLRTLLFVYKELKYEELEKWEKEYNMSLIENDRSKINQAIQLIENNFYLLGCTAIEDQLQDEVPKTIKSFIDIGIKVWVLTGDKPDTSMSVAFSCKLITHDFKIFDFENKFTKEDYINIINKNLDHINSTKTLNRKYALLIITEELTLITSDDELLDKFYQLAILCHSLICCRLSPKQKAELVQLIKNRQPDKITLAIGDGANDVNMIACAHIGIGIIGREGIQAAKNSDYALAQFSYLQRLLFVHGREFYRKNSYIIIFTFYKNTIAIGAQLYFSICSRWSDQIIFDITLYEMYNLVFTILPIIWYGVIDKEFKYNVLQHEGKYYIQGIKGKCFSLVRLWKWIIYGFFQGNLIMYVCMKLNETSTYSGMSKDMFNLGLTVLLVIIFLMNDKVIIKCNSFTGIEILLVIFSNMTCFLAIIVESIINSTILDLLKVNIKTVDFYLTVSGLSMFFLLIDEGLKVLGTYFRFITNSHNFAFDHGGYEDSLLRKQMTLQENIEIKDDLLIFNNYMGMAFSQESGQAPYIAKKLV